MMKKWILLLFVFSMVSKPSITVRGSIKKALSSTMNEQKEEEHLFRVEDIDDDDPAMDFVDGAQTKAYTGDVSYDTSDNERSDNADFVAEDLSDSSVPPSFEDIKKKLVGILDWKPQVIVRYFRYGSITLASRQPAILYRNGYPVLEIKNPEGGYKFINNAKIYYGDLIAVESTRRKDGAYGVAVDVRLKIKSYKGRRTKYIHYNTNNIGSLRVFRGDGELQGNWTTQKTGYCQLPRTRIAENGMVEKLKKHAPPLNKNTKYVWVSDVNNVTKIPETAYLRLLIGIRCEQGHELKRNINRIMLASKNGNEDAKERRQGGHKDNKGCARSEGKGKNEDGETSGSVSTKKENFSARMGKAIESYPVQCKCRVLPGNERSVCYDMLIPMKKYGRCKRRRCGRQYECVAGGGTGLKNCMRRISRYQTVVRRDYGGVCLCNAKKLDKPKVFYTVYQ